MELSIPQRSLILLRESLASISGCFEVRTWLGNSEIKPEWLPFHFVVQGLLVRHARSMEIENGFDFGDKFGAALVWYRSKNWNVAVFFNLASVIF